MKAHVILYQGSHNGKANFNYNMRTNCKYSLYV